MFESETSLVYHSTNLTEQFGIIFKTSLKLIILMSQLYTHEKMFFSLIKNLDLFHWFMEQFIRKMILNKKNHPQIYDTIFCGSKLKKWKDKTKPCFWSMASKYSQFFIFLILFLQNERVKRKSKEKKKNKRASDSIL